MGKRPKLTELDYLFEKGTTLEIPDKLYEEKTGVSLPKEKSYLIKRSALSARAKEKGYFIVDVVERPIIERIVILEKKEGLK